MTETFYGPWAVRLMDTNSPFDQRFVIAGSTNSDGVYATVTSTWTDVVGEEWTLTAEWLDGSRFQPSRVMRSALFDVQNGLMVILRADAGPPPTGFGTSMLVHLQSQDESLNPLRPSGNPFDFTIPPEIVVTEDSP
jgi:hypothetical protein